MKRWISRWLFVGARWARKSLLSSRNRHPQTVAEWECCFRFPSPLHDPIVAHLYKKHAITTLPADRADFLLFVPREDNLATIS